MVCPCGCGTSLDGRRAGTRFATAACRQKAKRRGDLVELEAAGFRSGALEAFSARLTAWEGSRPHLARLASHARRRGYGTR